MSSTNSFLSSTAYHASNSRYSSSQSSSSSSFNILSNSVQQQLNDLNSTRSSTSSCSTSHCLSNQCLECTTILSTRPTQSRCNLNSYVDTSSNSSHFISNCSYLSNSTLDNHTQLSANDDQQTARILSMNIPVDNSNNNQNENPINSSTLNIEIEENNDEQQTHLCNQDNDQNEQLEVFVGFYRPGEYQRETIEDDEDDEKSQTSQKSDSNKKEEQSTRELISDDDEGNEDQDFIDEDLGPNQDDDNDQQHQENEIINDEPLNPNIFDDDQQQQLESNEPAPFAVIIQIDEDEDQGFGAQFNDDCQSSDDENNHLSTISLNNNNNNNQHSNDYEYPYIKKKYLQRSQSDSQIGKASRQIFLSLPILSINNENNFQKFEHIIIDDQQPVTTMSNLIIKKRSDNDNDQLFLQKKKILRKSSEEIIEISNNESPTKTIVDEAVRDVERRVMLWNDDHARQINDQTSVQQIVQYFQLNININEDQQSNISSIRKELLLDYLQYQSEADVSANDLHENLLQYPEFSSNIHCRFFPFWPPRDVDLLQWLSHWIKQGALPVAIMNMYHYYSQKNIQHNLLTSWEHRIIYGVEPRGIYLMNPIQIRSPQQIYEQLTVDSITYITRQEILQRYERSPMCLTPLALSNNKSKLFSDTRWRTMNVLGQVVNVLREDRQLHENETRNIPYRPTVTQIRIPSTCSSGILIFSKDYNQLANATDLPLRQ